MESAFRLFEKNLDDIKYPNNEFNKIMSMMLGDINSFEFIVKRFRQNRKVLTLITREDNFLHHINPNRRSYPSHPIQQINNAGLKVDVQSLFIFGMILINRSLLLLKLYFPDKGSNPKNDMYSKIGAFYFEMDKLSNPSIVSQKFKSQFLVKIKWLYSTLRFYRNEFIEHLDKGYQQGMNFGIFGDDFSLSSYKWDYDEVEDNKKIEALRTKLVNQGVKISEIKDAPRSQINRYFIQKLFDNIILVPNNYLSESLDIIEDIGVHSPQPEKIINEIEEYVEGVLNFMAEEIRSSELIKYKT